MANGSTSSAACAVREPRCLSMAHGMLFSRFSAWRVRTITLQNISRRLDCSIPTITGGLPWRSEDGGSVCSRRESFEMEIIELFTKNIDGHPPTRFVKLLWQNTVAD